MHNRYIVIFILTVSCWFFWANIAQPGLWQAGGTTGFTFLFPEDSVHYKKIQMQKEFISIQLHKGFAVVRGEYHMKNDMGDSVFINCGYPKNAMYNTNSNSSDLASIHFGELDGLEVFIDDLKVSLDQSTVELNNGDYQSFSNDSWITWKTMFPPKSITKIEVYFIVNTNNSSVRKGYTLKSYNGFIYALQSGSSWKQPIERGAIEIRFMDGMKINHVHGGRPFDKFSYDPTTRTLHYTFENLTPTSNDDIVLTYGKRNEDFDFNRILSEKQSYFSSVRSLAQSKPNKADFIPVKFDSPFEVKSTLAKSLDSFAGVMKFVPVFFLALIAILLIKNRKRNKEF